MIRPAAFRVRVATRAYAELDDIFAYIAQDSARNAERMVHRILEHIERLSTMPRRFPQAPDTLSAEGEVRHAIVTPYRIIYEVIGRDVVVHSVRHGKRRPIGDDDEGALEG